MKVVFNGSTEKRTSGCPVCGAKRSESTFVTHRSFILPSGITKTFIAGRITDVTDNDGAFLLELTNGKEAMFHEADA